MVDSQRDGIKKLIKFNLTIYLYLFYLTNQQG